MDHIQTRPTPDPGQRLSEYGEPLAAQPGWTVPILMGLLHLVLWLPPVAAILVMGQRFKRIFSDFQMKLPWLTELTIAISDWINEWAVLLLIWMLGFLVVDVALLYALRQRSQVLVWIWFVLMILLP